MMHTYPRNMIPAYLWNFWTQWFRDGSICKLPPWGAGDVIISSIINLSLPGTGKMNFYRWTRKVSKWAYIRFLLIGTYLVENFFFTSICFFPTCFNISIRPLKYLILKWNGANAIIASIFVFILYPVSPVALNKFVQMWPLLQIFIKLQKNP